MKFELWTTSAWATIVHAAAAADARPAVLRPAFDTLLASLVTVLPCSACCAHLRANLRALQPRAASLPAQQLALELRNLVNAASGRPAFTMAQQQAFMQATDAQLEQYLWAFWWAVAFDADARVPALQVPRAFVDALLELWPARFAPLARVPLAAKGSTAAAAAKALQLPSGMWQQLQQRYGGPGASCSASADCIAEAAPRGGGGCTSVWCRPTVVVPLILLAVVLLALAIVATRDH